MSKKFPHNKGIKKGDLVLVNCSYDGQGYLSIFIRYKPEVSLQYIKLFDLLNPRGSYRSYKYRRAAAKILGTKNHYHLNKNDYKNVDRKKAMNMITLRIDYITTRFNERVWKIPESQLTEGQLECYKYMREIITA